MGSDILLIQNVTNDALQNAGSDFSAIALKLGHLANQLCHLVDDCSVSIELPEIDTAHPIEFFKSMRRIYRSSLDVYYKLESPTRTVDETKSILRVRIEEFGDHIEASAMNYGLNRLPNELLMQIFDHAADTIELAMALSAVCRRFRLLIIGSRQLWSRFDLDSSWRPEMILAVAERRGYRSLSANISMYFGLTEPVTTILDLREHLAELAVWNLTSELQSLRYYLYGSDMPALHSLYLNFRFLSSGQLQEFCPLPSLRDLKVNDIPHPSMARNLVRCSLRLHIELFLRDLLDFLSAAGSLQELSIHMTGEFKDQLVAHSLASIAIPNLTYLDILRESYFARTFMDKIVPFAIPKVGFSTTDISGVFRLLRTKSSVRELELRCPFDCWPSIFIDPIPRHVETLSLHEWYGKMMSRICNPTAFREHRLRLLRFKSCRELEIEHILAVRDLFSDVCHNRIQFEFEDCSGWKEGTFKLCDVESALS